MDVNFLLETRLSFPLYVACLQIVCWGVTQPVPHTQLPAGQESTWWPSWVWKPRPREPMGMAHLFVDVDSGHHVATAKRRNQGRNFSLSDNTSCLMYLLPYPPKS